MCAHPSKAVTSQTSVAIDAKRNNWPRLSSAKLAVKDVLKTMTKDVQEGREGARREHIIERQSRANNTNKQVNNTAE